MRLFPAAAPVLAVELRLAHSQQQLHQQLAGARSSLNSTLSQPSSLLVVTAIGTLLGIWLARRKTAIVTSAIASLWPLVRSALWAFLIRIVVQGITNSVARSRTGERKSS